jgi:hypothetical protein
MCVDVVQQGPKKQMYVFIELSITQTSYFPGLEIEPLLGHYTRKVEILFLCSGL